MGDGGSLEDGRLAPAHPSLAHPSLASGTKTISAYAGGLEMEDGELRIKSYEV